MTTATHPSPSPASAVPLSAMPVAAIAAEPPAPSWRDRALHRLQPLATYGALFLMGLSGGLAVATVSSLALHYFAGADKQVASVHIDLPRPAAEPLDIEIQKAKAELDAAVAAHGS